MLNKATSLDVFGYGCGMVLVSVSDEEMIWAYVIAQNSLCSTNRSRANIGLLCGNPSPKRPGRLSMLLPQKSSKIQSSENGATVLGKLSEIVQESSA